MVVLSANETLFLVIARGHAKFSAPIMKGDIMNMAKHYKKMNRDELIETLEILDAMQEDLRQIYEKEFGNKVGQQITDEIEVGLYTKIENNLSKIILARRCIKERLSLEFNTFIM